MKIDLQQNKFNNLPKLLKFNVVQHGEIFNQLSNIEKKDGFL